MPPNKRITDLSDYTSVLPYASELFGVYQPMIGWRSKRQLRRLSDGIRETKDGLLRQLAANYMADLPKIDMHAPDCYAEIGHIRIGRPLGPRLITESGNQLMAAIARTLPAEPPVEADWEQLLNDDVLRNLLDTDVRAGHAAEISAACRGLSNREDADAIARIVHDHKVRIRQESALAAALLALVQRRDYAQLRQLFYVEPDRETAKADAELVALLNADDPLKTFDPKQDISSVALSPLGIVHLFRQYFFELDSFLGTPTGHVWLSPGATVELIEVSTRRTYTERIIEASTEKSTKAELSTTTKDELSEAVKTDNKSDLKLGASLTVNQSWGSGSATATGSINLDKTQQTARESAHKRMREQSSKLTTEIKENYKTTFKTINEVIETASKRYVLSNTTDDLLNYELRRKMRQVGVQVQDVGTYLCWETFVDEPGRDLGLASLVHIASPADLDPVPAQSETPYPPDKDVSITGNLAWTFDDDRQYNGPDGFVPLGAISLPPAPEGYELKYPGSRVNLVQISGTGEDFAGAWAFGGKLVSTSEVQAGVITGPGGIEWDERVDFVVGGVVTYTPTAAAKQAIDAANAASKTATEAATRENERKTRESFVKAARERIEVASEVGARKYEDLREEERIIVYRRLITALMSDALYHMPESLANDRTRHVMSELLNAIFDIDKMLYFVAPEWWKPRLHRHQFLAQESNEAIFERNLTNWSDNEARIDNYYITEKSRYAKLGSSLGWLLQLDGDDLRNAFLNAPWVKAVIPVRPGKELEAINWLQQVNVEGTDGMTALYQAPDAELDEIRATLGIQNVTIADAITYLCAKVTKKHNDSLKSDRYPTEEINDDNRVSATPVDKVYEHGFYPLKDGFRAVTSEPFEVFDQWIEVLPTDQVVPVPVSYNPKTGRQI